MAVRTVIADFASTLHEFHHVTGKGKRNFPKAAIVHPSALEELLQTTPSYAVKRQEQTFYLYGVKMLTDASLEADRVDFVVPDYLMKTVIGVKRPPVLDCKPEYNGRGYKPPIDPMASDQW